MGVEASMKPEKNPDKRRNSSFIMLMKDGRDSLVNNDCQGTESLLSVKRAVKKLPGLY